MTHPDENILSKFAMGTGLPQRERNSVARHLAVCHGCRTMVEELEEVYAFAEEKVTTQGEDQPAVSPSAIAVAPRANATPGFVRPIRLTEALGGAIQRAVHFARSRPVTTGVGVLALGGFVLFGVHWADQRIAALNPEPRPAFPHFNGIHSEIEIYSEESAKLWQVPLYWGDDALRSDDERLEQLCSVSGFLGNGKIQFLTGMPFTQEGEVVHNAIRSFDNRGNPLWTKRFDRSVTFRSELYNSSYAIACVNTLPGGKTPGSREIFFNATDERSPSVFVRMAADSMTIGEYWHFGHLRTFKPGVLTGHPGNLIFLYGINDLADKTDSSFGAIVVLDPGRIIGTTESTVTPGFGFAASQAELYYIRADRPRLPVAAAATIGKGGFVQSKRGGDSSLTFLSKSGTLDGRPVISYYFDSHMNFLKARMDDASRRSLREILGSYKAVEEYIRALEKAVRYWDGRAWRTGFTPVAHGGLPG